MSFSELVHWIERRTIEPRVIQRSERLLQSPVIVVYHQLYYIARTAADRLIRQVRSTVLDSPHFSTRVCGVVGHERIVTGFYFYRDLREIVIGIKITDCIKVLYDQRY